MYSLAFEAHFGRPIYFDFGRDLLSFDHEDTVKLFEHKQRQLNSPKSLSDIDSVRYVMVSYFHEQPGTVNSHILLTSSEDGAPELSFVSRVILETSPKQLTS